MLKLLRRPLDLHSGKCSVGGDTLEPRKNQYPSFPVQSLAQYAMAEFALGDSPAKQRQRIRK